MSNLRIMSNNIWWCDTNNAAWEAIGADCSAATRASALPTFLEAVAHFPYHLVSRVCIHTIGR